MTNKKPSLRQLYVLNSAASSSDGTDSMVPTATARSLFAKGWATAKRGGQGWVITITDEGRAAHSAATSEQIRAAIFDHYAPKGHGGGARNWK